MRLDETESAIIKNCSCLHRAFGWLLSAKPEVVLSLVRAKGVRAMHCILSGISAEKAAKGLRCLSLGRRCVGWTNSLTPALNSILSNKFHTDDNVASDELLQVWEEGLLLMLAIELLTSLFVEARHLHFIEYEALGLDCVNDLSHLGVAVWLNHGKGALSLGLEFSPGGNITVIRYFQNARQNCNLSSNEEIIELQSWDLLLLEEDAPILHIEHLN